jgi:hypothetical protein
MLGVSGFGFRDLASNVTQTGTMKLSGVNFTLKYVAKKVLRVYQVGLGIRV